VAVADSLISLPAFSFPSRKLRYAAPVLALLLVAGIMLFGFHGIKAAGNSPHSAANAGLHPANQEAKDLYLQGRFYWNKRTPDDLQKAVDYFTRRLCTIRDIRMPMLDWLTATTCCASIAR
jgi:hypothetical protein